MTCSLHGSLYITNQGSATAGSYILIWVKAKTKVLLLQVLIWVIYYDSRFWRLSAKTLV